MSDIQRLVQREVRSKEAIRIVTVIGDKRMLAMSPGTTGPVWVTDVEFGSGRPMRNVPVKSINGSMLYADRGQTVQIRRSTLGRWQIVGPGDRLASIQNTREYDLTSGLQVGPTVNTGFGFIVQPYEFYQGPNSMKGNPSVEFFDTGTHRIVRATGDFLVDGFANGDSLVIQRSDFNNFDPLAVVTVTATTLEFAGTPFQAEGPRTGVGIVVDLTSIWNSGTAPPGYPEVTLVDGDGQPA